MGEMNILDKGNNIGQIPNGGKKFHTSVGRRKRMTRCENKEAEARF